MKAGKYYAVAVWAEVSARQIFEDAGRIAPGGCLVAGISGERLDSGDGRFELTLVEPTIPATLGLQALDVYAPIEGDTPAGLHWEPLEATN